MPSKFIPRRLPLLYIDDNPDDRLLLAEAIRSTNTSFDFHGAGCLDRAMDYFDFLPAVNRPHRYLRPALVLLDYELGSHCGLDFLFWLRTQHRNTAVPVVMYSDSAGTDTVGLCYANGANHFLRKADSFQRTKAVIMTLRACFSLRTARFELLARLPESEPDPRVPELIAV